MDDFGQLKVHKVALTTVAVPNEEGGEPTLYAALGIWADLSPFREAGLEVGLHDGLVPGVATIDAFALPGGARVGLVVSPVSSREQAGPFTPTVLEHLTDDEADADDASGDKPAEGSDGAEECADEVPLTLAEILDPEMPRFNLTLPTTALGLATSLTTVPIAFRVALIDGTPPADPEFTVLAPEDLSVIVLIDASIAHDALCGRVPAQLHYPIPYPHEHGDEPYTTLDSMRAAMWAMTSGVALGQPAAFRRLLGFGVWAETAAEQGDTERIEAIIENADTIANLSMDALVEEEASLNLGSLPQPMASLTPLVDEHINVLALMNLADGVPFARVASEHGLHKALPALGVLVAARAHVAAAEYADGSTVSWLLGIWLDGESEHPLWAFPSSSAALAHHDVDVMADLLFTQPDGYTAEDSGPLLQRYVHMLAEAVLTMDLSDEDLESGLRGLDVTPVNFADVLNLAMTLQTTGLEAAEADNGACPGCEAMTPVMGAWEPQRLARAAAALLPCLADLDAAESGHTIGEEPWVAYRKEFLDRWLHIAA